MTCPWLCGLSALRAAELCDETLRSVTENDTPAYEGWRRRIREHLQFDEFPWRERSRASDLATTARSV